MDTTRFHLVRHGTNDFVERQQIAGRLPGIGLNATGQAQAELAARWLAQRPIRHIGTSPLERAVETAAPLARELNLVPEPLPGLAEIDFGEWTGKRIGDLDPLPEWRRWNRFRTGTRIPGGESILEVQTRMVAALESVRQRFPGAEVALFSHGDPIRSVLMYYLGMPLDNWQRLEISPGSVSTLNLGCWGARVSALNLTFTR